MLLPLDMLRAGEWGEIETVCGQPAFINRLAELGLREGCRVRVVQSGVPCLLDLGGCRLCLRTDECAQILVRPLSCSLSAN